MDNCKPLQAQCIRNQLGSCGLIGAYRTGISLALLQRESDECNCNDNDPPAPKRPDNNEIDNPFDVQHPSRHAGVDVQHSISPSL